MAEVVAEFLGESGLEPMGPVGRLESAMQMARECALDGAILDINLNGRPCFPVCAILSARRIPFIFLTGYPHAAVPIEYRGAPLVAKPFEPNELKKTLASCCRYRSKANLASGIDATSAYDDRLSDTADRQTRSIIEDYIRRSGVDLKPTHKVEYLSMAMSLVASTRGSRCYQLMHETS